MSRWSIAVGLTDVGGDGYDDSDGDFIDDDGSEVDVDHRDSKSGERGEHALAIFLPLLC